MIGHDIQVDLKDFVATVEIRRGPNNFFDQALIEELASVYETLDTDDACRAIVLCSEGKHFCAGANFADRATDPTAQTARTRALYGAAVRLFRAAKPVVAAVQGAAVGGGLGVALTADFRVTCEEARFCANFSRLGLHPGFGISVTLPRLIGRARADLMLFTGRRVKGAEALKMGLADELAPLDEVRTRAWALAREIAGSAPLAVQSIRRTSRAGLAEEVERMVAHELIEQTWLKDTEDFAEGIRAMAERREPGFRNR